MKAVKIIPFLLIMIIASALSACAANTGEPAGNTEISTNSNISGYEFPDESGFVFSADIEQSEVQAGDNIVIPCSLKNETGSVCYIMHGSDTISYAYNGEEEIMNAIGVEENFADGAEITRTVTVPATDSGTLTVTAEFTVLENEYSETSKEYHYQKTFEITVR